MSGGATGGGESPGPLLILGSGQRCGSTLVQRLLISHPEVMVWGEHGGHLHDLIEASSNLRKFDEAKGAAAREQFAERGTDGWIATLLPEPGIVAGAARAYLEALFAAPAVALGRPRWGFKEVRFGLKDAEAIRELYPLTRVIHVTRDPRDQLSSIDYWERTAPGWFRQMTRNSMRQWTEVNSSFLEGLAERRWISSWRFEDIVADPDRFVATISDLIEVDPGDLDKAVFERRVSDYPGVNRRSRPFDQLPRSMRKLLDRELKAVAEAYGYSL
jgi:hypothetical protein